ncbi:MAG TPA: SDR family oxidoreductase [Dehalococcoidia bacterium]|nr:SDR family oxidoreductase [Dehalococcoidia bacterium]
MSKSDWALILGASSGFGGAAALELARRGMNIFGVHLDTRATLPNAQRVVSQVKEAGREVIFFNTNAADIGKRDEVLAKVEERLRGSGESVRVLLHSLAFGTLKPFVAGRAEEAINSSQLQMTMEVMANSLVYWVQGLLLRGLMGAGGRVFAMTSSGAHRVIPCYGAVSAAKAALESHVRQLALELAPIDISVNAVRAGVTDTAALRKIPGHENIARLALERNPHHRMTTPEDVARAIGVLSGPEAHWMTGTVIGVDGGEDITG